MSEQITCRAAVATDADIITHHAHGWGEATEADKHAYSTWVYSALSRRIYIGMLAIADGKVIAGAGAILFEGGPVLGTSSPMRARLSNVYTEPEFRSQGLSEALCKQVLNELAKLGIRSVALACTNDSRRLYERLGFKGYPAEMRIVLADPEVASNRAK